MKKVYFYIFFKSIVIIFLYFLYKDNNVLRYSFIRMFDENDCDRFFNK